MILIFDLDDTLYPEIDFVKSGMRAVADFMQEKHGFDSKQTLEFLLWSLNNNGRGEVFDDLLKKHDIWSRSKVDKLVSVYRHHSPSIELFDAAKNVLERYYQDSDLFLVTDGHKIVQKNKITALCLNKYFVRMFITHRFGIKNAKPSTHCFELIKKSKKTDWDKLVYIADNPAKDFVNLKKLGVKTIRVLTGSYASVKAVPGYDAEYHIENLDFLADVLCLF